MDVHRGERGRSWDEETQRGMGRGVGEERLKKRGEEIGLAIHEGMSREISQDR